jgi:hypothetical protein
VKEIPPVAYPTMPRTIRSIPMIVAAFIEVLAFPRNQ